MQLDLIKNYLLSHPPSGDIAKVDIPSVPSSDTNESSSKLKGVVGALCTFTGYFDIDGYFVARCADTQADLDIFESYEIPLGSFVDGQLNTPPPVHHPEFGTCRLRIKFEEEPFLEKGNSQILKRSQGTFFKNNGNLLKNLKDSVVETPRITESKTVLPEEDLDLERLSW